MRYGKKGGLRCDFILKSSACRIGRTPPSKKACVIFDLEFRFVRSDIETAFVMRSFVREFHILALAVSRSIEYLFRGLTFAVHSTKT